MDDERFTEEALKGQDGKIVPVTLFPGGPVIGKATLKYVPGIGLETEIQIADALPKEQGPHIQEGE